MPYETFDFTVAGPVATITFNRPDKANAMILPFWQELVAVVDEIDDRPEIRAVVIASIGKHFTGGLDLAAFGTNAGDMLPGDLRTVGQEVRRAVPRLQATLQRFARCPERGVEWKTGWLGRGVGGC